MCREGCEKDGGCQDETSNHQHLVFVLAEKVFISMSVLILLHYMNIEGFSTGTPVRPPSLSLVKVDSPEISKLSYI